MDSSRTSPILPLPTASVVLITVVYDFHTECSLGIGRILHVESHPLEWSGGMLPQEN